LGGPALGVGELARRRPAAEWDRFARWPALRARLVLIALALMVLASALVPITAGSSAVATASFTQAVTGQAWPAERARDDDLAFYDRVIERLADGERYYDFIVGEQRDRGYAVNPRLNVRLPTLAHIESWLGEPGEIAVAIALLLATLVAWWRRLGEEAGPDRRRLWQMALLYFGVSLGLNRYHFVLHELWTGMLLALSFGLHRPGKWHASLAVAALALAIRELALPFVALMAAMAFWRRDWKEGAAWTALIAGFLAALALHLDAVSAHVLASDLPSESWLAMRGLSGWLSDIVLSSNLRFLPGWLAGPLVMLALAGWAGWRSPAGAFGTLLFLGYGAAFMIAGRDNNFYWGMVVAPTLFLGLAFAPRALLGLVRSALGKT